MHNLNVFNGNYLWTFAEKKNNNQENRREHDPIFIRRELCNDLRYLHANILILNFI